MNMACRSLKKPPQFLNKLDDTSSLGNGGSNMMGVLPKEILTSIIHAFIPVRPRFKDVVRDHNIVSCRCRPPISPLPFEATRSRTHTLNALANVSRGLRELVQAVLESECSQREFTLYISDFGLAFEQASSASPEWRENSAALLFERTLPKIRRLTIQVVVDCSWDWFVPWSPTRVTTQLWSHIDALNSCHLYDIDMTPQIQAVRVNVTAVTQEYDCRELAYSQYVQGLRRHAAKTGFPNTEEFVCAKRACVAYRREFNVALASFEMGPGDAIALGKRCGRHLAGCLIQLDYVTRCFQRQWDLSCTAPHINRKHMVRKKKMKEWWGTSEDFEQAVEEASRRYILTKSTDTRDQELNISTFFVHNDSLFAWGRSWDLD